MATMPPMHVVSYETNGTTHTGEFEFYDSALDIASMAENGAYIGQRVWPLLHCLTDLAAGRGADSSNRPARGTATENTTIIKKGHDHARHHAM